MSHRYRILNKYNDEVRTPAEEPVTSYREEMLVPPAIRIADDEIDPKLMRRSTSEGAILKTRNKCLYIGIWNVQTLYQVGKLENLINEMESMHLDMIGLQKHWTEEGKVVREDHTMVYSGGEQHRTGVGLVMRSSIARTMIGYWPISEREIMIK